MKCVICKTGDVKPSSVEAEIKVGCDRLVVPVEAEVCEQCGEAYYSAQVVRHLEKVRDDFARRAIAPPPSARSISSRSQAGAPREAT